MRSRYNGNYIRLSCINLGNFGDLNIVDLQIDDLPNNNMEPGSRADNPPEQASSKLADIVGTLIAILTLIMPMVAIAYYSTPDTSPGLITPVNMRR
jgi:hypothetical protein